MGVAPPAPSEVHFDGLFISLFLEQTSHDQIVPIGRVIKRAKSNLPPDKVLVRRFHHGSFHVVEKDANGSGFSMSNNADMVPLVIPGGARRCFCTDLGSIGSIHNKNLIGVVVCLLPKVHVVKMSWVLVPEKEASVAMPIIWMGRLDINVDLK